jgi:phage/plasmid-associated DNA primase
MSKERLILKDGVLDISGPYIRYTQKEPEEETLSHLPYTTAELFDAKPPARFLDFLASTFPDEKTAETALFYLSLIVSKNTEFKYGGIFLGGPETGKTALMTILAEALPLYIHFFSIPKFQVKPVDLAIMDGLGAAVIQELDSGSRIETAIYKSLTGNDTLTGKFLYKEPFKFTPTAQLIIITNHFPRFSNIDDALTARIVVIPFSVPRRRGEPGTIPVSKLKESFRAEFPSIVKLLAGCYVLLKHKHNGIIPQSKQCKKLKKIYLLNPVFLKCDYCKEYFHIEDILLESDLDHCPYCGSIVKQAQPHAGRKRE